MKYAKNDPDTGRKPRQGTKIARKMINRCCFHAKFSMAHLRTRVANRKDNKKQETEGGGTEKQAKTSENEENDA
jgi:hypothetical protein